MTHHGGYAEAMIAQATALASIPDELSAVEAAPLLCAGISTFNGLRRCGAQPGDLVAIQGTGGLGHLALQFAVRMGFRVVAIDIGTDLGEIANRLGAHYYIDAATQSFSQVLSSLGGAKAILATAPSAKAMSEAIDGLTADGTLVVLGLPQEPIAVPAFSLISGRSIKGTAGGVAVEAEDAMAFSVLNDVRPMIETMPLERAAEAYERMITGKARCRVVLTTGL